MKRRQFVLTSCTAGAIVIAGCLGDDEDGPGQPDDDDGTAPTNDGENAVDEEFDGTVRAGHFSPDAPHVDIYVDGEPILEDIAYRDVSERLDLSPDSYDLTVTAVDDPDTVAYDDEVEFDGGDQTILAIGELEEQYQPYDVVDYVEDLSDPGPDAQFRLVHASPDAPAVDESAQVLFEDVAFADEATTEMPADDSTLEVRDATEEADGAILATFEVSPEAGTVYTAVATGYLDPAAAPIDEPFDLVFVGDPGG